MRKIMYLIDYPLDLIGGAQGSTISICEELDRDKFEPIIVCPRLINEKSLYNFNIIEYEKKVKSKYLGLIELMLTLRDICKREKPDIIHAQMPLSAIAVGLMKKMHICKNAKFVFTDRGFYTGYNKLTRGVLTIALKEADKIVLTTKLNMELWKENLSNKELMVIHNSPSPQFENALANSSANHIELNKKKFTIGFAGRYSSIKNWPLVIRICEKIVDNNLDIRVNIAVSAYTENEKKALNQFCIDIEKILGNENLNIDIDVTQEKIVDFYNKLDVFILTSLIEPFGKTAIEAMGAGCSVIASNVGGLPEVIGIESNLCKSDDEESFYKYINMVYNNRELLQSHKQYFQKRYKEYFTLAKNVEKYKKIYEDISNGY